MEEVIYIQIACRIILFIKIIHTTSYQKIKPAFFENFIFFHSFDLFIQFHQSFCKIYRSIFIRRLTAIGIAYPVINKLPVNCGNSCSFHQGRISKEQIVCSLDLLKTDLFLFDEMPSEHLIPRPGLKRYKDFSTHILRCKHIFLWHVFFDK